VFCALNTPLRIASRTSGARLRCGALVTSM
jgi:hypothetical protein